VDEGGTRSAHISFEKNDAGLTLLFVIAGLVPAIQRGANVICDLALHSCCTMDCRNKSGNDSIGGVKLSPSTQSGEYLKGEGVVGVVRLLRTSPEQTPPPGDAVLTRPQEAKGEKGIVAFDTPAAWPFTLLTASTSKIQGIQVVTKSP
jgi:hypothetical protein